MTEPKDDAFKILNSDFIQCFHQMRHYDGQILDLLKFSFTGYTALAGIALAVYKFGIEKKVDLTLPIVVALAIGLTMGFIILALMVRNRAYYVPLARYVNHIRGLAFNHRPLDFENITKMYINYKKPPFFHWRSTQAWMIYIESILNSALLGILLYIAGVVTSINSCLILACFILMAIQIIWAALYLSSLEKKSVDEAIFGKTK